MRKEGKEELLCLGMSKCQTLPCATTTPEGPAPQALAPGHSAAWAHEVHVAQRMGQSHHASQSPSFNCCSKDRQGKSTPGSLVCLSDARMETQTRPQTSSSTGRALQIWPHIPVNPRSQKTISIWNEIRLWGMQTCTISTLLYGDGAGMNLAKQTAVDERYHN